MSSKTRSSPRGSCSRVSRAAGPSNEPVPSPAEDADSQRRKRAASEAGSAMTDPVSWLQIEQGWSVLTSDGVVVGTVAQVEGDKQSDIFDGLAVASKQPDPDPLRAGRAGRSDLSRRGDLEDGVRGHRCARAVSRHRLPRRSGFRGRRLSRLGCRTGCGASDSGTFSLAEQRVHLTRGHTGETGSPREAAAAQPLQRVVGGTGLEPVTPSLSSWCSPN